MFKDNEIIINKVYDDRMLQFKLTICGYSYINIDTAKIGQDQAIFITCDDITKDMQMNLYDQMNQFKMKIIASISHKLKTPLNCSLNLIQEMMDVELIEDELIEKYLNPAYNSQLLLSSYINDLCDYAGLEMKNFSLNYTQFNLLSTIKNCVKLFDDQISVKLLTVEIIYDEKIPDQICTDQVRLSQIIINILSNAIKYSKEGKIIFQAKYNIDDYIMIIINDQGIGIEKQQIQSIFQAWDCIYSNSIDYVKSRGAGLGLTITAKLVKQLSDKKIILKSKQNQGTSFKFYIKNQQSQQQPSLDNSLVSQQLEQQQQFWTFYSRLSDNSKQNNNNNQPSQKTLYSRKNINSLDSNKTFSDNTDQVLDEKNQIQLTKSVEYKFPQAFTPENQNYVSQNKDLDENVIQNLSPIIKKSKTQKMSYYKKYQTQTTSIQQKCNCPQILIVDDDNYNIYVMKIMLQSLSFTCDSAENGQLAVDRVKKKFQDSQCCKSYKLIIMDIDMPIKNGYDSATEIQEFFKNIQNDDIDILDSQPINYPPVIIACSAFIGDEDKKRAIQVGMKYYIEKPVKKEKLIEYIKNIL